MHDFKNKFLPAAFMNYWPTNREYCNQNIVDEGRELRNDSELYLSIPRLTSTAKFPFFHLPRIWNDFDNEHPELSIIRNRLKFKLNLKTNLISELNSNPNCGRLFCYACSRIQ